MLKKWKILIGNWINCYFNDDNRNDYVNVDTLINIISHLRENLNLDESKSSVLKAQTVEEFILEKYPQFKFKNGTVGVSNEEDFYLVASLLLFFVCVNSKDVHIKSAMCSRLSSDDQETILKYNKSLMECSPITCADVQAAITEACGLDTASVASSSNLSVAETPPVLRSLHGEVRRLQAALEAERFDRNYLQEELARTNLKIEKLIKEKDKYKLEIVDLKSKISFCTEDNESRNSEDEADRCAQLLKQVKDMEDRLEHAQAQLDDVLSERDIYKRKVENLKLDRNKWLALSQQESDRANELFEELERERCTAQTLREVVAELRQHNRLNELDTSQLECDDLETSTRSFPHNSSLCSEACANVVEVQLSEERAKIVVLKEQIEMLQGQVNDLTLKAESERQTYEALINEKEHEVNDLKHHINEIYEENNNLKNQNKNEIEEKNALKCRINDIMEENNALRKHFDDEMSKMNNEVNELEQKLKENAENYRKIVDSKLHEIEILQEEKMSLLESLNNQIARLQMEVDNEKHAKTSMKDSYENKIMKLKEKVLNRNNELMALQNNICEKSEMIESLHLELRNEKESREDLWSKYNNEVRLLNEEKTIFQSNFFDKSSEVEELANQLKEKDFDIQELTRENESLKQTVNDLTVNCKVLERDMVGLMQNVEAYDKKIDSMSNVINNLKITNEEDKNRLQEELNKKSEQIDILNMELKDAMEFKLGLQKDITYYEEEKTSLKQELCLLNSQIQERETSIHNIRKDLQKEINAKEILSVENNKLKEEFDKVTAELTEQNKLMESLKASFETQAKHCDEQVEEKSKLICQLNNKIKEVIEKSETINTLQNQLQNEIKLKLSLQDDVASCEQEKGSLKQEVGVLNSKILERETVIETIRKDLQKEEHAKDILIAESNTLKKELDKVKTDLTEQYKLTETLRENLEAQIKRLNEKAEEKSELINELNNTIKKGIQEIYTLEDGINLLKTDKNYLEQEISQKSEHISQLQAECDKLTQTIEQHKVELSKQSETYATSMSSKIKDIQLLQQENQALHNDLNDVKLQLEVKVHSLKEKLVDNENLTDKLKHSYECQVDNLNLMITKLTSYLKDKTVELENFRKEKEQLILCNEENREAIKSLEDEVRTEKQNQEKLIADFESERQVLKNMITVTESVMEDQKMALNHTNLEHVKAIEVLKEDIKSLKESAGKEKLTLEVSLEQKDIALTSLCKELNDVKEENKKLLSEIEFEKQQSSRQITEFNEDLTAKINEIHQLVLEKQDIETALKNCIEEKQILLKCNDELKIKYDSEEIELKNSISKLNDALHEQSNFKRALELTLKEKAQQNEELVDKLRVLQEEINILKEVNRDLDVEKNEVMSKLNEAKEKIDANEIDKVEVNKLKTENMHLVGIIEDNKTVVNALEGLIKHDLEQKNLCVNIHNTHNTFNEKLKLISKFTILQDYWKEKEIKLDECRKQINELKNEIQNLEHKIEVSERDLMTKDEFISRINKDKDSVINKISKELTDEKAAKEKYQKEVHAKTVLTEELMLNVKESKDLKEVINVFKKENEDLIHVVGQKETIIKSLEDEVRTEKQNREQLVSDFESERQVLKNMIMVTESIMEDQKIALNNANLEHVNAIEVLKEDIRNLKESAEKDKLTLEEYLEQKDKELNYLSKELYNVVEEKKKLISETEFVKQQLQREIVESKQELQMRVKELQQIILEKQDMEIVLKNYSKEIQMLQKYNDELKIKCDAEEMECKNAITKLNEALNEQSNIKNNFELTLKEKVQHNDELKEKLKILDEEVTLLKEENRNLEINRDEVLSELAKANEKIDANEIDKVEMNKLKTENIYMIGVIEENKTVITNLEQLIKHELEENQKLRANTSDEKINLISKFNILQDCRKRTEIELDECRKEINTLKNEIENLQQQIKIAEQDLIAKDGFISKITKEKDSVISAISKELLDEKTVREKYFQELQAKSILIHELMLNVEELNSLRNVVEVLRKENSNLIQVVGQKETAELLSQEKLSSLKHSGQGKDHHHQVDKDSSSDITHSSLESLKTITDLEKIIHDKNRTITTLQSDITYLKTLLADSETKLMDVTNELDVTKENCQQLSNQLKKIVYQKNEEIAELKKQVNKMSATENRASQIIKVSAKYQAIILKRIAEIKSNTILKELTNFGNTNSCDNEIRRSLNAGSITMEDLENFLETTDRHLKRCSEKQIALQKERDRLSEVNRINESELIHLKKFLTELTVVMQTFNSVKDMYTQKLNRIFSIQRTVRREILNLDGQVTDACMCKLERGFAAVMQDLSECSMTLERWVERCVSRAVSVEKIKQAFSDSDRPSVAPGSFQNAGLEVQLEELEKSFQKLLEEVARAQRGEGAKDALAVTLMEVKAEYEDKLNRMKAKMKQLYNEQMTIIKEKQNEEISILERELQKARNALAESSRTYEEHISKLTSELWTVGEKFLMKKDEAEWLKRHQKFGSLMSLQHVHSSGLVPPPEEPSRPSESHSLRSLPVVNEGKPKREGRGLHMSDEEGEVFDNRWLKELAATPRREGRERRETREGGEAAPPGLRLSELKWRNSLCPPHLKSSYPAETQFAPALDEEDIKCLSSIQGKQQRKEVGITAYKKPGPPTPSKQAGRLSATDSELRESLRVECDPHANRKTSTPSRLRSLFRSNKNDTNEGTPRSRRLSNIFRKK